MSHIKIQGLVLRQNANVCETLPRSLNKAMLEQDLTNELLEHLKNLE